jgi:hypothetical protein
VNFSANLGIGSSEDTYGLRFQLFKPRAVVASRVQPSTAKKGCVMYHATSSDYVSRIAYMFGSSIEDILLNNLKAVSEPDMLLGGVTLLVCGASPTLPSPALPMNRTPPQLLQQTALLAIKAAIDEFNSLRWQVNSSAGLQQHCSWPGVICNDAGDVTQLTLKGRRLVGSLPKVQLLEALPKLESLGLGNNSLAGPLPADYGRLSGLKGLYLWDNPIMGSIPCSFSGLDSLETLDMSEAQLTGTLCPEFQQWSRITDVTLWGNRLRGKLPQQYGAWRKLTYLSLASNALTGSIPSTWQGMVELQMLNLHSNKLSGTLPASLGFLGSLQELYLYRNYLTGTLPASWSSLVSEQLQRAATAVCHLRCKPFGSQACLCSRSCVTAPGLLLHVWSGKCCWLTAALLHLQHEDQQHPSRLAC